MMQHTPRYILLLGLLLWALSPIQAQVDTEFWFAAPSLVNEHKPDEIRLVITTYDEPATVSITQPAQSRTLLAARIIPAQSVYSFPISTVNDYQNSVETQPGAVRDNGLLIRSSAKVGAYYTTYAPNAEIYTLKGRHGQGTDFVVPMQKRRNCGHNAYCSIEVVATENNTTVTFQTTQPTNLSPTAGTHTITLQRGQSYAIRSLNPNTTAAQHLGGTRVTSDKPICVNTTDDSAASGADLDLIGEQLVPTSLTGSQYIIPAGNSQDDEYVYVYAIDQAVTIMTNNGAGPTQVGVATPQQPLTVPLTKLHATYLYSNDGEPFICFHLTGKINGTELSGTVLPALSCSGSEQVSFVPVLSQTEVHLSILTRSENTGYFVINGIANPTGLQEAFQPVPGAPEWSYCSCYNLRLGLGESGFTIRNTEGVFHLGVNDNADNQGATSYGYFSNYGQISLFAGTPDSHYRVGDNVCFQLTAQNEYENIVWRGPDGQVIPTENGVLCFEELTMADAGRYIVSANHREGCDAYPDTIFLTIFDGVGDASYRICEGDSLYLRTQGSAPYEWYANDEEMEDVHTRGTWVYPTENTLYAVDCRMQGVDMAYWENEGEFALTTTDSITIWQQHYQHLVSGAEYTWYVHLRAPQNNAVAPKVRLYANGQPLTLLSVPNGTRGIDYRYTYTAIHTEADLKLVAVSPRQGRHLEMDSMSFTPALLVTEEWDVEVMETPTPTIQGPATLLQGTNATLHVDIEADAYRWSTGEETQDIQISEPGTYKVNVYVGNCFATAEIYVEGVLPEPTCPEPKYDTVHVVLCDTLLPYRWRGQYYSLPGTYDDTLKIRLSNQAECDSIYYTLLLDTVQCLPPVLIYPDPVCPNPIYTDTLQILICDTLLPYRWRGKYYRESGLYEDTLHQTNDDGSVCDIAYYYMNMSVVHCEPLITQLEVNLLQWQFEVCDGDETLDIPYHEAVGLATHAQMGDGEMIVLGQDGFVHMPLHSTPGDYSTSVTFIDQTNNLRTAPIEISYTILYDPLKVFAHLWNNVLAIYAPAYSGYPDEEWTAYRWYKNDQMTSETGSYYHVADGELQADDCYRLLLTRRRDGAQVWTCPYCIPHTESAPAQEETITPTVTKTVENNQIIIHREENNYSIYGTRL